MLFDDELALRNMVGLFRSSALGSAPMTIHRQKSSSSDVRSSQSRSQSVDLDLHALYNSPRSFREALEMIGSGTEDDWAGDANSPIREGAGLKPEERAAGPDNGDRGRRSISVAVTSSVDLVFERVSKDLIDKSAAGKRASALSDALNAKKTPPAASKAAPGRLMSAGPDEAMHKITVYLPDRSPLQLRAPASMTFHEVIRLVLYTVRSHPTLSARVKLTDNPANYELRLHEGDGEADDDFPALDRNGKVKHFGDTTTHEYCLREIAGSRSGGRSTSPQPSSDGASSPRRAACASPAVLPSITVVLPNMSQTKVAVDGSKTTVHDVLNRVLKDNHRLQFSTEVFCLHYSDADRQKRRLPAEALDVGLTVVELGVDTLMLKRKAFADDPASLSQQAQDGSNVSFQPGGQPGAKQEGEEAALATQQERRPDPESFVFTAETAFVYKEWTVTKKNKFGRKQIRVLGMDDSKIYNYKRDSKGNRRVDGVYRAERPISTVRSVDFVDEDIKMLRIQFEEDGALNVAEYTAESAYECAEMVYRLRYIVRKGAGGTAAGNRA